jgi:hypothetical protein
MLLKSTSFPPTFFTFESWTKYQLVRMTDVRQKCTLEINQQKGTGKNSVSSNKSCTFLKDEFIFESFVTNHMETASLFHLIHISSIVTSRDIMGGKVIEYLHH